MAISSGRRAPIFLSDGDFGPTFFSRSLSDGGRVTSKKSMSMLSSVSNVPKLSVAILMLRRVDAVAREDWVNTCIRLLLSSVNTKSSAPTCPISMSNSMSTAVIFLSKRVATMSLGSRVWKAEFGER